MPHACAYSSRKRQAALDVMLAVENDRRRRVTTAQKVLGEIETGIGKEARPGHAIQMLDERARPSSPRMPPKSQTASQKSPGRSMEIGAELR